MRASGLGILIKHDPCGFDRTSIAYIWYMDNRDGEDILYGFELLELDALQPRTNQSPLRIDAVTLVLRSEVPSIGTFAQKHLTNSNPIP